MDHGGSRPACEEEWNHPNSESMDTCEIRPRGCNAAARCNRQACASTCAKSKTDTRNQFPPISIIYIHMIYIYIYIKGVGDHTSAIESY